MSRYLIMGAAALAMMSGVALAQTAPYGSSSTTTVVTPGAAAPDAGYNSSVTKRTTHEDGTQTTRTRTYENGIAGSSETRTKSTVDPDSGDTVTRSKTTESQH